MVPLTEGLAKPPETFAKAPSAAPTTPLMGAARELESTFLYEMLKSAGVGKSRDGFGGGVGEDQFSNFLIQNQADAITQSGGIGLAHAIYENLLERQK